MSSPGRSFRFPRISPQLIWGARLAQTGYIGPEEHIGLDDVKKMLCRRFEQIDFDNARQDVMPFVRDTGVLSLWSEEFFTEITKELH